MKVNLILLIFVLIASGTYTYITMNKDEPLFTSKTVTRQHIKENENTIDDFTYMRLNGSKGSLHEHLGRTTLLHFWATWCAPCLVELPELIELAVKQPNIDVLAISTDQKTSEITRFIKKTGKTIPKNFIIITDPDKSITQDRFQTFKLPETYILSPQLAIHKKIIGANDEWTAPEMIETLDALSQ